MNGVVSASDEVGSRCEDRSAVLQCCLMSVKVLDGSKLHQQKTVPIFQLDTPLCP